MINTFKKNQIIILAIAIMLITAGYISYTMNTEQIAETSAMTEKTEIAGIGDAKLVSNNNVITDEFDAGNTSTSGKKDTNANSQNTEVNKSAQQNENETAKPVSSNVDKDLEKYFSESKLEREKMYSEMLESYQQILASSDVLQDQKGTAQTEISNINKQRNAIMIAENLIKNKGFKDIVIFVNNDSVSAVVRAEKVETAEVAQIQSIIQRELSVKPENIHISNK